MLDQTILIVDDDASNRDIMRRILEPLRCRVVMARDGEEALEQFGLCAPDVVLLDVEMPRLNGYEVCRRLKSISDGRLTPVVLVTGLAETTQRIEGLDAGADDLLAKPFDGTELIARVRSLLQLKSYTDELERAEAVLLVLARTIEARDPCTDGHCSRLSGMAVALGKRCGLPEDDIRALSIAGVVHDIGKVAVPDAVLLKAGPLTCEERAIMQQHPSLGHRICAPLKSFRRVLPIIRHHHERADGSGYPDGLVGEAIPITARVLQVVDVYDALSSQRPYKSGMSTASAFAVMAEEVARGWWDPRVFREFRLLMSGTDGAGP